MAATITPVPGRARRVVMSEGAGINAPAGHVGGQATANEADEAVGGRGATGRSTGETVITAWVVMVLLPR